MPEEGEATRKPARLYRYKCNLARFVYLEHLCRVSVVSAFGYNVHLQDPTTFPFLRADLATAPHTSSCGHVMHARCWQKYFDDVSESERRRYRLA